MDLPQQERQEMLPPNEVAKRLELSSAGLRRLAKAYEHVFETLPRDPRLGRLWPQEAIERLERARAIFHAGRTPSVEAALAALARGDDAGESIVRTEPRPDPLELLVGEIRALREAVEAQGRRIDELVTENRELRAALPAPQAAEEPEKPKRGWFAWLRRGT